MKTQFKVSNVLFAILLAGLVHTAAAQNTSTSGYYRQAYDQGFQAAQADSSAGRPYNYHAALITAGGLSGISRDYRNAFQAGYQDGYYNRNNSQNSDYYYRRHRHDSDCTENGPPGLRGEGPPGQRGNGNFNCQERHDNGLHKGWYKNRGNGNGNGRGKGRGRGHGNKHDDDDNN